jgi:DNA-binding NarL/FixJ family response regulator
MISTLGLIMKQIELVLADRSPVVMSGFIRFLQENRDIEIVREVSNLNDLSKAIASHAGCVCIVDWQMVSLAEVSQFAASCEMILSAMPEDVAERRQALRAGARGFLGRYATSADIQKAITTVANGHLCIGNSTAEAILNDELANARARSVDSDRVGQLTTRERQVIQAACEGLNSGGIALKLRISRSTVAHHLTSIFAKLSVKDRSSLIIYAYKHGLHVAETMTFDVAPTITPIVSTIQHVDTTSMAGMLYPETLWQRGA